VSIKQRVEQTIKQFEDDDAGEYDVCSQCMEWILKGDEPDSNVVNPLLDEVGVIDNKSCLNCEHGKPAKYDQGCTIMRELLKGDKVNSKIYCCYWIKRANFA